MDDIPQGTPMDVRDHPADTGHTATEHHEGTQVGIGENIARFMNSGRDLGQRVFYNETRAGLLNPNTPPDEASPMGGLGRSMKSRRESQGYQSSSISRSVRKDLRE
jgi:hypothetical protein